MEVFSLADNKLTKAQQAAGQKKRKKLTVEESSPKSREKATLPPPKEEKRDPRAILRGDAAFPLRYAFAAFCALLLLIFISVLFTKDGLILQWFVSLVTGLFGRNFYYISIPTLIYLIYIQLFSRNQRVRGRSFSMVAFALLAGCLFHLIANPVLDQAGLGQIAERFESGTLGLSGGVICGIVTDLLCLAFGRFFIFSILLILIVVCLMIGARLDLVGLLRRGRDFVLLKLQERRAAREEAQYVDYADDYEEDLPLWARAMDLLARRRAERKAAKQENALKARTAQLLQRMAPEYEEKLKEKIDIIDPEPPVDIYPDEPEVRAEVAADPGTAAPVPVKKQVTAQETAQAAAAVEDEIAAAQAVPKPKYSFPPIDLLQRPRGRAADGTAEMKENTFRLNESLASYKIDAHISNVTRGPSVTRYEVELEKGVRLNKLTSCADDIALSLGASGVRIAPVPGKISVVGIEVPNQSVTNVSLREVIDSAEFNRAAGKSSIAVGKDIGGACIIGNIAKFPHMLIAGTTGSGKSVCMNSIIISLLYKASPEDVKLIMVDPKMVELGIYNGIPHLLIPVVTDPKKAAGSLQWAVTEMMRRYRSMSDAGVRDLESYNSMIEGGEIEGERLPQVVVIIDELADLMLVAAKEVEESICRIAQMGRAAGIHLIIATQRPSADVITGLMKANIPSRIAFSVASAMESRIILDTVGAEKLVGKGDMLYSPIGSGKPQRVQGCFVTDSEVEAVATYVKEHFASTYDQAVMDDIERKAEQSGSKGAPPTASDPDPSADELAHDEMLPDAVEVILETKQASVSMLQRRLKLGYARAARIVDEMEEMGIVGPFVGSKPRQILITKEQWDQMKQGQTIVTEPEPEPVPEDSDIPF